MNMEPDLHPAHIILILNMTVFGRSGLLKSLVFCFRQPVVDFNHSGCCVGCGRGDYCDLFYEVGKLLIFTI